MKSSRSPVLGIVFLLLVAGAAVVAVLVLKPEKEDTTPLTSSAPEQPTDKAKSLVESAPTRVEDVQPQKAETLIAFEIVCLGPAGPSAPLGGVEVTATPVGPGYMSKETSKALTDSNGVATFKDLPYKSYSVEAQPPKFHKLILGKVEDKDRFTLLFGEPIHLTGKVIAYDTQQPIEKVFVSTYSGLEGELAAVRIQNIIREKRDPKEIEEYNNRGLPRYQDRLFTNADGTFEFFMPTGYGTKLRFYHDNFDSLEEDLQPKEGEDILDRTFTLIPRTEIFGTVVDDVTGNPIANAKVQASEGGIPIDAITALGGGNDVFDSMTDSNGAYRLTRIPRGKQYITVNQPGYDVYRENFDISQLEPFEKNIRLIKGATVSGRVLDAANKPVKGAAVRWIPIQAMAFASQGISQRPAVTTGPDGTFEIPSIPINQRFTLIVNHNDYMESTVEDLNLEPGKNLTGVDVVLSRGGSISGKVRAIASGKPIEDAIITARSVQPPLPALPKVKSNTDGSYAIPNTRPGLYEVTCDVPGYCTLKLPNVRDIVTDVDFDLVKEAIYSGQLTNATTGEPIDKFRVRSKMAKDSGGQLVKTEVIREKDGKFELKGLRPGAWDFEFTSDDTAPLVLSGVMFREGEEIRDQVLQATQGARAVGHVTSTTGNPIDYALVRFEYLESFSSSDKTYLNLQAQTDANGEFTVPRMRPGRYRAWATHMKYAQAREIEVVIEDGPETRVDFLLPRPAKLRLFVRDEFGNTVEGAKVMLFRGDSPIDSAVKVSGGGGGTGLQLPDNTKAGIMSLSDADSHRSGFNIPVGPSGELVWHRKEPGEWTLWVTAKNFDKYIKRLELEAGKETVEEAVLVRRGEGSVEPPDEGADAQEDRRKARQDRRKNQGKEDGETGDGEKDGDGGSDGGLRK